MSMFNATFNNIYYLFIYLFIYCIYYNLLLTGSSGNPIQILTNAFCVECTVTDWILYQYHVDFNPEVDNKRVRIAMIADHRELLGNTRAFDGMTLFMPRRLSQKARFFLSK